MTAHEDRNITTTTRSINQLQTPRSQLGLHTTSLRRTLDCCSSKKRLAYSNGLVLYSALKVQTSAVVSASHAWMPGSWGVSSISIFEYHSNAIYLAPKANSTYAKWVCVYLTCFYTWHGSNDHFHRRWSFRPPYCSRSRCTLHAPWLGFRGTLRQSRYQLHSIRHVR